jgi:alpha-1,2-mannosyltransferase
MEWAREVLWVGAQALLVLGLVFCSALLVLAVVLRARRKPSGADVSLGFFHPYCHAGGGGERVLWCAVQALASASSRPPSSGGRSSSSSSSSSASSARPRLEVVIYTGDAGVSGEEILSRARDRFGITVPASLRVRFVYISTRTLLEAWRYPRFTLIGQALGSVVVAVDCLLRHVPDIWVDTTGAAFTFPVARLAGSRVACYVHYPMISTDMLAKVRERRPDYNNQGAVAGSGTATAAKLVYYRAFAAAYSAVGRLADVVMVNSTWTKGHIDSLWGTSGGTRSGGERPGEGEDGAARTPTGVRRRKLTSSSSSGAGGSRRAFTGDMSVMPDEDDWAPLPPGASRSPVYRFCRFCLCCGGSCCGLFGSCMRRRAVAGEGAGADGGAGDGDAASAADDHPAHIVYPPCNTDALQALPLRPRNRIVVSVAQFRPEKDHPLQLRAFAAFRARDPAAFGDVRLLLIGGVRDEGDQARVDALRTLADELGIGGSVDFLVNAPFSQLRSSLGRAAATLHTMWNEHFGIGVVESMAAGAITLAHNSGGPRSDILVPWGGQRTGFLAATPEEYADALELVFRNVAAEGGKGRAGAAAAAAKGAVDLVAIAAAARDSAARFSDNEFSTAFFAHMVGLIREVEGSR